MIGLISPTEIELGSVTVQGKDVSFFRRDESHCFAGGSPVSSEKKTHLFLISNQPSFVHRGATYPRSGSFTMFDCVSDPLRGKQKHNFTIRKY